MKKKTFFTIIAIFAICIFKFFIQVNLDENVCIDALEQGFTKQGLYVNENLINN